MRADAAGARRKSGGGGAWARQQPAAATACDGPRGGDGRAVSVFSRGACAPPPTHTARATERSAYTKLSSLCRFVGGVCGGLESRDSRWGSFNVRISFLRDFQYSKDKTPVFHENGGKRKQGRNPSFSAEKGGRISGCLACFHREPHCRLCSERVKTNGEISGRCRHRVSLSPPQVK